MDYLNEYKKESLDSYNTIIVFNCPTPVCTAIDTINEIKSSEYLKAITIFVIAPNLDQEEVRELYKIHVNAYIIKPDDFKGLVKLISRFKGLWSLAELP